MDYARTYIFVLHIKDDHPERYRDHQHRWTLELNAQHRRLPIEYFTIDYHGGTYHVAWCRPEFMDRITKRVRWVWDPLYFYQSIHSPLKWVRDYPVHHVNGEQFGTSPNHIRAAVNGAFYSWLLGDLNPLPTPDGDIGDGTTGDWMHGNNCESRRWAFGMDATGCAFGSGRMRWAGFYSNEGHEIFMVPDYIEQSFAYGFSNVGLLVDNGGMLTSTQSVWGANADNAMPRTAVAWSSLESGRRHFFW
ncbi:MAG: hypothetical protein K6U00_01000 [Armatimonadetes bacterium]|nr:hypothetical protein [Armatimonadota bacterium]